MEVMEATATEEATAEATAEAMYLTTVDITEVTAMTTADITISKISKKNRFR